MKIVLTGGHITPAIAMLPLLSSHALLFVVRKHTYEGDTGGSYEYKTVQELGLPFKTIATGRLQRHFTIYTIPSLLRFPVGFLQSLFILASFKPNVIVSFGGYVALPVCLAGFLLKIPIVIHEQTVGAGLANKLTGFLAKKICVTFPQSGAFFPKQKVVHTGNPLRKELFDPPSTPPFGIPRHHRFPLIYVTGGSGGSHDINILIEELLEVLLREAIVVHQTGSIELFGDYSRLTKKAETLPKELRDCYIPKKHIAPSELAWLYGNASLLVGRSGANTVNEILTFRIPSLLIPLSVAAGGEQEANAKLVENAGIGKVISQEGLTGAMLLGHIESMISKTRKREKPMSNDAPERIMNVVKDVSSL